MGTGVFFNIPLHGHTNATFPVVQELVERGERITYYLTESFRPQVERTGARFFAYRSHLETTLKGDSLHALPFHMPEESRVVIPQVLEDVRAQRPDYILCDPLCTWGLIVARHLRIPAIAFRPVMVMEPRVPLIQGFMQQLAQRMPEAITRANQELEELLISYGIPPMGVLEFMGQTEPLNVVCLPRAFQAGGELLDERYVFVGPSIRARGDTGNFPFEHLEGGPVLFISLGTVFNNWPEFYRMCFQAFGGTPWRVVLSTGSAVDPASLGEVPANFLVRPSVPQLEVLERTSLFITHGGANSLMEAFAHAVPVVVLPQMAEQPLNALRVAQLGLGVALPPGRETLTVEQLRQSVAQVEGEPAYRERVKAMQQEVLSAGGYRRAADAILAFRP